MVFINTVVWIVLGIVAWVSVVEGERPDLDVYRGQVIPHVKHWGYGDNVNGPDSWQDLYPATCSRYYQSPIDIRTEETVYNPNLREFVLAYYPPRPGSKFIVLNNGHSIQVNTQGEFYMYNGGLHHLYKTAEFHFHWGENNQIGSEHNIDGVQSPLELHIVNWNLDKYRSIEEAAKYPDGLAVLSVLYNVSMYDNPVLERIVEAIPYVRDPDWSYNVDIAAISLRHFLPEGANRYYRYNGSLTTPRCIEGVIWTVFEQKQTISERQLNVFRQTLTSAHDNGAHVTTAYDIHRERQMVHTTSAHYSGESHGIHSCYTARLFVVPLSLCTLIQQIIFIVKS